MAAEIRPEDWERHKDTIIGMRRSGHTVRGPGGIMESMEREHDFVASHNQYESQLGKWAERKNLTRNEWRSILQVVDQHRQAGNTCQVFLYDRRISERALQKKRTLYGGDQYVEVRQASASDLPECIFIRPSGQQSLDFGVAASNELDIQAPDIFDEPTVALSGLQRGTEVSQAVEDADIDMPNVEQHAPGPVLDQDIITADTAPAAFEPMDSSVSFPRSALFNIFDPFRARNPISIVNPSRQGSQECTPNSLDPGAGRTDGHVGFHARNAHEQAVLNLFSSIGPPTPRHSFDGSNLIELDLNQANGDLELWSPSLQTIDNQAWFQDRVAFNSSVADLAGPSDPRWRCLDDRFSIPSPDAGPQDLHRPTDFGHVLSFSSGDYSGGDTDLVRQGHEPLPLFDVVASGQDLANVASIRSNLAALLPPTAVTFTALLQDRSRALVQAYESPIYRILISSIENNFAGLDHMPIGEVFKLLRQDNLMRSKLINYLNQTPNAVAMALVEKLLVAAIEEQDALTVRDLLGTRLVKPDDIVCSFQGRRYTGVERSVMLCSAEVLIALLRAGADVDKTLTDASDSSKKQSILAHALQAMKQKGDVNIQTVSLLLEHGVKADLETCLLAVQLNHKGLIDLLLPNLRPPDHVEPVTLDYDGRRYVKNLLDELLWSVIKTLSEDAATGIIKELLRFILLLHLDTKLDHYDADDSKRTLERVATYAARRGYAKVLNVLHPFANDVAGPLAGAIRNGSPDLIQLLITPRANVVGGLCFLDDDLNCTTPFAEALRSHNGELVRDFGCQTTWDQCDKNGRSLADGYEAALCAASEVGNLFWVRKLLDHPILSKEEVYINGLSEKPRSSWSGRAPLISEPRLGNSVQPRALLTSSLYASVENDHEQITWELLNAGAYVTEPEDFPSRRGVFYSDLKTLAHRHPLFQALCQGKKQLFDTIMECNINLTVFLGSLCFAEAFESEKGWAVDSLLAMRPFEEVEYLRAALFAAIHARKTQMFDLAVQRLSLSSDINSNCPEHSTVSQVMRDGDFEIIPRLLELGADPRDALCLPEKSEKGTLSDEILMAILRAFSTRYPGGVKGCGATALQHAIRLENMELLDKMLKAKLDVNARGVNARDVNARHVNARDDEKTSLGLAISQIGTHRLEIVEKIIRAGGDVNGLVWLSSEMDPAYGMPRRTALLEAILTKNKTLVQLLVDFGADIYRSARLGLKRTPLQQACEVGSIEIVDLLLSMSADVNEEPAVRGGATSLQLCAIKGYVGIATKLLRKGADVHAAPSVVDGRTPLQGAAENGRLDMITVLWVAAGFRKFDEEDCRRAVDLAKKNGHIACRDLIEELLGAS